VLDSVADRLKISKSELLDPSSDNAAVRVALAESHVIAETKKYFETVSPPLSSPSGSDH
jgi:multiple RNA-binding domain-containing protein 1